jgi:hypothetical protein
MSLILLQTGQWLPMGTAVELKYIKAIYDATEHLVHAPGSTKEPTLWFWKEARCGSHNLTAFFSGLRYTGIYLSTLDVLMLYAHQKGWVPDGPVEITYRNGSVSSFSFFGFAGSNHEPSVWR